jgi:hypothetical protein
MSRYKTLGMMKDGGMQKDINDYRFGTGTLYLLANQRGVHLVTTNPQHLLVQGGGLLDTSAAHNGSYIFVMDGDGNIYSADKAQVSHHSAFLAGGPVAAAGHWQVTNGVVQWISNVSGHYQPPIDYCKQILKELKRRGISVNGITQNWTGGDSKTSAKASKKHGITFKRLGPKGVVTSPF